MDGWKTTFLFGWPIFRGYVSFRECIYVKFRGCTFLAKFPRAVGQVPEAFLSFAQMDSWTRCKLFLRALAWRKQELEWLKGYKTLFFARVLGFMIKE